VPFITIVTGGLLIALGLWGYFPDARSVTALIPAFGGIALVILGALAMKPTMLKHAMHAAAMIGVLGFLAGAGWFLAKLIKDGKIPEGPSGISTGLMAVVCAVFVGLCVNSFVQARRRRQSGSPA
jgi:hypothetical protein